MYRPLTASLLLVALCACRQAPAPVVSQATATAAPSPAAPVLVPSPARWQGFADWDFDTPLQQLLDGGARELGQALAADPAACRYLGVPGQDPQQLMLMVEGGRLVRYDVRGAGLVAPGGGAVGMTLAQLKMRYPDQTSVQPNKYARGALDLRVDPPSGQAHALVFEIDADGFVRHWRLGLVPQADYVEGCS